MKSTRRLFSAAIFVGSVLFAEKALSQTYYLDVNGATENSGITAGGSYDVATTIWSTAADGSGASVAHTANKPYVISAGTDAAGLNYTLTGSLQQPSKLTIEEGYVTLSSTLDTFRGPIIQTENGTSLVVSAPNLRSTATFNTLGSSTVDLFRISNTNGASTTFIKNGPGSLVVNNAASNIRPSFTSTINNGTVRIKNGNAFYLNDPTRLTFISLTVNTGGTLELDNNITVASNPITIHGPGFNNGIVDLGAIANFAGSNNYNSLITLGSASRINNNAAGTTLTLNPADSRAITGPFGLTVGGAGDVVVSKSIEFVTELAKDGAGTLTLSATNSYGGNTVVSEGTLSLGNGTTHTSLTDSADVVVAPGAILNLNYTGTDTIDQLILADVPVEPGIYGSSHPSNRITGTGTLTVLNGPTASSAYDTWATTTHGLSGGNAAFDFDYDNDGLANGLEWILGGDPKVGTTAVSPLASRDTNGNLVLHFTREEDSITESTLTLQYDTDLDGSWANSFVIDADGGTDANGVSVVIDQVPDPDTVVVTIPAAAVPGGKAFVRLEATKP